MSGLALVLVLGAALAHAVWNLYAKRAAAGGLAFIWLTTVLGTTIYAPLGIWQITTTGVALGLPEAAFIIVSVVLHTAYFSLLQRAYSLGDLSVVYPVARGLAPVLAITGAVIIFGERPTAQAIGGAVLVCGAIATLGLASGHDTSFDRQGRRTIGYASLTALAIAGYTLWDAHAVNALAIPPLVFMWIGSVIRLGLLTPIVWPRRVLLRQVWDEHRVAVVAVATLSPLAYLLVLFAFTLAPVSYVAPVREISILIGTALGARLLGEGQVSLRLAAAAAVLVGVVIVVTG